MGKTLNSLKLWIQDARHPDIVLRSLRVALIVGTLLVLINQGNNLLNGALLAELAWKIPLTYCVPYMVSTYASVDAMRRTELGKTA